MEDKQAELNAVAEQMVAEEKEIEDATSMIFGDGGVEPDMDNTSLFE